MNPFATMRLIFLLFCCLQQFVVLAFQQAARTTHIVATRSSFRLRAVEYDQVFEVGYSVSVQKPLGIIFGENPDPYFGLVVDDVSEGLNGGMAGLRVGDQLLAIDGEVVVGIGSGAHLDVRNGS